MPRLRATTRAFVCSVTLSLVIVGAAASPATAATGGISGTVTGPDGQGVAGVLVSVFESGDDDSSSWAQTKADGGYDVDSLPTGTYRLLFSDVSGAEYVSEYWDDAPTLQDATDIAVTEGQTTSDMNAQLAASGHITGTVTGVDDEPLENVIVRAYHWSDEYGYWTPAEDSSTDERGHYDIGGLATGTYRIEFDDDLGQGLREYWDDADTIEGATDIDVTLGETVSDTDAQLAEGGHITGTVTNPDGDVVSDIAVIAHWWDSGEGRWRGAGFSHTDDLGHYDVNQLPTGTYRLQFYDPSGERYLGEYWNDADTILEATDIAVTAGMTVTSKDVELAVYSTPAIAIVNTALPTISGTAQVGAPLTATIGTWDPATGLSGAYRWLVDGQPVAGATGAAYVPVIGDVGKTVRFEVTASKSGYTSATAVSAATAVVAPPDPAVESTTLPTITGTARVGMTVTATPGAWNPTSAIVRYQWLVAGVPVAYATTPSYEPVAADAGKQLQVRVTATAPGNTTGTATSVPVAVGKGTLKATKKPKVTGKAKKNATLKVSPGTWSAKAKVTYQWYAGTKAIPKATAAKLKLAGKTLQTVAGKAISVLVTVTAPGYSTVTTKLKVLGKVKVR